MKKIIFNLWLFFIASFTFIWAASIPEDYETKHILVLLISLLTVAITAAYGQVANFEKSDRK